jgi:hypothetical protein
VQLNIDAQLDILTGIVKDQINKQNQQDTVEFEKALRSLNAIKARVTVLTNILQASQDRLLALNDKVTNSA